MTKLREFVESLPDDRLTTFEIIEVGNLNDINGTDVLRVKGIDGSGEERSVVIPVDDEKLQFDAETFTLTGGRVSSSKKSYSSPGYNWKIKTNETFTAVDQLFANADNTEEMIHEGKVEDEVPVL